MPIHAQIAKYSDKIRGLCIKHGISSAYVFGSATSDKFNSNSDLDLLVIPEIYGKPEDIGDRLWCFEEELEVLLGRPVDLITNSSLQNPYFKAAIEKELVQIHG